MKKRKKRNKKIKKINKKNRPDGKKRYALYLQTGRKYIKKVSLLLIPLGLIAVLGVYSYHFLCTSPVFYLSQIKVKTNGRMDEAAVKRYAGLNDKTRIFKLRPDSISRKLQSLPQVKRARVIKVFPDRLIVELEERKAIVQIKLNRYYLIDEEGVVLPWVNNAPVSDLPLLIGINFRKSKVSIGQRYPSEKLDRALESLKALSSSSLLAVKDIALVDTRISRDIIFTTKGGLKIRLGKEDFEKKISLLERVLEDIYIKHKRIKLIDLRFGDVIVKP